MQWRIMNGLTKVQDGVANWMHALVLMKPNGCSLSIWSEHTPFEYKGGKSGRLNTRLGGPRQQDHSSMNVHILNKLHARQKHNEKKALD